MRILLRIAGSVLTACGLALLGYVGLSYLHARPGAAPVRWTSSQQVAGRQIAQRLSHRQAVAIPREKIAAHLGQEQAVRMVIPKIGVDAPVVQTPPVAGVWEVADWAVGHLTTTSNPGVPGNGGYAAHDDIKGEIFKRLGEVAPGDRILLYTRHAVFTYEVTRQTVVDPSDTRPLAPTSLPTITLISCVPYWVDTQRLIVQAVMKSTKLL